MSFLIYDHISLRSLWLDEAAVANVISNPISNLLEKAIIDGHHLSYIFPIKIWSLIFGDSETSLRLYSSIWTVLLIILIYKAGKYFFNSKKVGTIAALLASTSYFLVWYSIQVRPYTQATFTGLASTYYFVKCIRDKKKINEILYTFFTIIGIYNHTWLILIFFSQIFFIFIQRKKIASKKSIYVCQAISSIFMIPYLFILRKQSGLGINTWIDKPDFLILVESLKYLCYGLVLPYLVTTLIGYFTLISKSQLDKPKDKLINTLLIFYLFIPLISAFLVSQFIPAYVAGRYEIVVLPALILLLAKFWSLIDSKILLVVFIIIFFLTYNKVLAEKKEILNYKSTDKTVATSILEETHENDLIITTDLSYATFNYYLNHLNDEQKSSDIVSFPSCISEHGGWKNQTKMEENLHIYEKEAEDLLKHIENNDIENIWLIYNIDDNLVNKLILDKIETNFSLVDSIKPEEPRQPAWFDEVYHFR